jgi:uncharacterized protein (DUF1501 family)
MKTPSDSLSRRSFLQANCAAIGSTSILSTLLNLRMANNAAADNLTLGGDCKSLVCIFLGGGYDSYNVLVPRDTTAYTEYQTTRSNLALQPYQMIALNQANGGDGRNYYLHDSAPGLADMFNGTGSFAGNRRLSFVPNVGTLVQPTTLAEYQSRSVPLPKALFSHSDQSEQWQTSMPQGMQQLSGWAGRTADVLHSTLNTGVTSMSISLSGNNVMQTGQDVTQFVVNGTSALNFTGMDSSNPFFSAKNTTLQSLMNKHYANTFEQSFANLTMDSVDASERFGSAFESAPTFATPFPDNNLARQLNTIAKTIAVRQQLGLRRQTFFVNYGGWDHHAELLASQAARLSTLDGALTAFQLTLEELNMQDDVITFSASDFSRTLRSNGRGTDHAWGGNAFVMGGPIDGGKVKSTTLRPSGYPTIVLDGPDDIGRGGLLLPTTSVDEYLGEMLSWFGVASSAMDQVLPNITSFYNPSSLNKPIGFVA